MIGCTVQERWDVFKRRLGNLHRNGKPKNQADLRRISGRVVGVTDYELSVLVDGETLNLPKDEMEIVTE